MTALTTPAPPAPASEGFWRRNRIWVAVAVAFLAAVAVATLSGEGPRYDDPYDPENPGPQGGQAVARVLEQQGVEVIVARSAAELEEHEVGRRTTVVVTGTERLAPSTAQRLVAHAADGDLVLVEPGPVALEEFKGRVAPEPLLGDEVAAGCEEYAGLTLEVDLAMAFGQRARGCFDSDSGPILAEADDGSVAFGAGEALTNDQVLRADNAAVALRLLGQNPRLIWYLPSYDDADDDEVVGLGDLLPDWIVPSLWLALVAGGALMLWRARRLGPLSTEPLPVVVRAVETARSRGRMYRRSNDRGHAARALRAASRRRAAERLDLGRSAHEATVVAALAHHLDRPVAELTALLGSQAPPPASDAALVALVDELARLDREVGRG